MFSIFNGNVDLYPKQTIAKESPTKTISTSACSAIDPDIESQAVNAIIFRVWKLLFLFFLGFLNFCLASLIQDLDSFVV